ncbi:MAG: hypothetical protein M4579_007436, partial [Chaenotheca gracillima]
RDDSASAEVTPGPTLTDTVGLFLLNVDNPSPVSTYQVDIVAVHGLGGGAFKTWTDKKGNIWLRDLLIEDLPGARVFTFGYNSAFFFSRETGTLREYARALLEAIRSERTSAEERARPLVFVCHGMGGIVVKKALIIARNESSLYPHFNASVSGVLFLGTPHQGLPSATYASILSQIANVFMIGSQMSRFTGPLRTELLQSLQRNENELLYIAQDFRVHTGPLMIASFIEQKNMLGLNERIVDEKSGLVGASNERIVPMPGCDHRELCRYSWKSNNYKKLLSAIKDGTQIHQNVIQLGEVVCIVDALDECQEDDRNRLMKAISTYCSTHTSKGKIKFLVTRRPYRELDFDINPPTGRSTFIRFDGDDKSDLIANEINQVIEATIPHTIPEVPQSVQNAIVEHLRDMQNRTHLWLHLIFDFIKKNIAGHGTKRKLRQLLEKIPPGFDQPTPILWTVILTRQRSRLLHNGATCRSYGSSFSMELMRMLKPVNTQHLRSLGICRSRVLVEHGAQYTTQDNHITALLSASATGDEQIVRLLLEHGADVNIPITDEYMALWLASPADYEMTVRFGYVFPRMALLVDLRGGQERIARVLLEHGADVNTRSAHDYTALWLASCEGYEQSVRLLLEYGSDANAVASVHPRTAIQVASQQGHEQIVRLLVKHGAERDAQDSDRIELPTT